MNILVLNASPKGANSTTVHTALYLQALHPEHTFTLVPVGQRIKSYEKDFTALRVELKKADLLLFCYPVYTFIAPYQLHRLIELIKAYVEENDIERPTDLVVKSIVNKQQNKVYIIQGIDRKLPLEDIAEAKNLEFNELLEEIESIVYSGTKLNIDYYLSQTIDDDKIDDIYSYFKEEAETDSIQEAAKELGPDYTEEEIRLVRIKFISELGN